MDREYFVFYTEASIVCVVIFGIMLLNDLAKGNRSERQIRFSYALIAQMLYFISDGFWAAVISGQLPRTSLSMALPNLLNAVLMSALAYEWFMYACVALGLPIGKTWKSRLLVLSPAIATTLFMVVSYLIRPSFWIKEDMTINALYDPLMLAAPLIYIICTFCFSLAYAARKENIANRRIGLLIGVYPLSVVLFGFIQLLVLNAPLFCFGCTVMMLFFYIRNMEDQISLDPLTRLNNRGQLLRYIYQEEAHRRDSGRSFIVMIDADRFKEINDTWGHAAGDSALVQIAESLKAAASGLATPPFIARYGGDEFILVVRSGNEDELAALSDRIRKLLARKLRDDASPYPLTVSIGYSELGRDETFQACMDRADQALYRDKARRKELGRS